MLGELEQIAGHDRAVLDRERLAADVIEASVDPRVAPEVWQAYRNVLGDETSSEALD